MSQDATEPSLDAVEIFHDLTADERARLTAELDTLSLKRGETLVRQGEPADALYIVVTGRFIVTLDGSRVPIAELGPGQPVGEIAFLAGGTRTATVTALRDSLVLRLGRADFEALSAKSPSIWRTLTVTLARRVAEANLSRPPPPDPRPRTLALIRAGDSALPPLFVERLRRALGPTTLLLDAQRAREVLPAGTALDSTEATRALNALEGRTDYVLYLADPELTPWSEKAVRQADLVLAVGWHAAGERPIPSSVSPPSCCPATPSASSFCTASAAPSPARRAGSRTGASPCTITSRSTSKATWPALPASYTERRADWSRAAAVPTARPTSDCTRPCNRPASPST